MRKKKPVLNNEALKEITTLSLLVGRFDKMQAYAMNRCDASLLSFEIEHWGADRPFRKNLEPFAKHYPLVKNYVNQMNLIFDRQDKYRKEHGLQTLEDWLKENKK